MRHWLPLTVTKMGRGAPKNASRTVNACKRCKKAKHKCDNSRPCGRCIYMRKEAECIEEVGQHQDGIAAEGPASFSAFGDPRNPRTCAGREAW